VEKPISNENTASGLSPRGVRLLLARHGQTAWNRQRRFLGRSDIPLDETGLAQAQQLASALSPAALLPFRLDRIVSSPLDRAQQTARAVSQLHGLPVELNPDLVEMDQGELEGQPGRVLLERYPELLRRWTSDPTHLRLPGGETLGECQARGVAALVAIARQSGDGSTVLVVSHQLVIASTLCAILGLPLRQFRQCSHENTAFSLVEVHGDRLSLLSAPFLAQSPA